MEDSGRIKFNIPQDLKKCIEFHGHLCPGLVYGYIVAKEAIRLLGLERSKDEEVVTISENDSCAVDALQVMLGTSTGKGNLILKNYGKNAYTIINRSNEKAFRFSRKKTYRYAGEFKEEFERVDKAISAGTAGKKEIKRHKMMKAKDLLSRPFSDIFSTRDNDLDMPSYAPLARSVPCSKCGEMTMSTKMVVKENGMNLCIPCSEKSW